MNADVKQFASSLAIKFFVATLVCFAAACLFEKGSVEQAIVISAGLSQLLSAVGVAMTADLP